jgi:hypothetical protein
VQHQQPGQKQSQHCIVIWIVNWIVSTVCAAFPASAAAAVCIIIMANQPIKHSTLATPAATVATLATQLVC